MTDDLIERLRFTYMGQSHLTTTERFYGWQDLGEAADALEQCRAEVARREQSNLYLENERLRARVAELEAAIAEVLKWQGTFPGQGKLLATLTPVSEDGK